MFATSAVIGLWRISVITVLQQREKLLSADMLYIPDLVQDVLLGSGRLSDWFFAPSPELFTEIPFYLPFALFWSSIQGAVFSYAASQAIYTAMLCWILLWLFIGKRACTGLAIASVAGLAAATLFVVDQTVLIPFYHYATFLDGLILIVGVLFVRGRYSQSALWTLVVLIVITGSLVISSGFIFVAWFVLPLIGLLFLEGLYRPRDWYRLVSVGFALVAATVLGRYWWGQLEFKVDPRVMSRTSDKALLDRLSDPLELLTQIMDYVPEFIALQFSSPMRGTMFVIFVVASLLVLTRKAWVQRHLGAVQEWTRLQYFSLIALVIVLSNVGLFALHDQQPARYMITANYLSMVYSIVLISIVFISVRAKTLSFLLVACVLITAGARAGITDKVRIDYDEIKPAGVDCIIDVAESHHLTRGVAQYWQARPLTLLSNKRLKVVPIHGVTLKPYFWASSRRQFSGQYDFAVVDHSVDDATSWTTKAWYSIDRSKIIRLNGKPMEIAWCDQSEILIYPSGTMRVAEKMTTLPRLPITVSSQIYWAEKDDAFTEKNSNKTIYETELSELGFYEVDVNVSQDIPIVGGLPFRLRLDPGDRPGYVEVTDLEVLLRDFEGQETVMMSAASSKELAAMIKRSNDLLVAQKSGDLWRVDQFDPWIEFKMIDAGQVLSGNVVSVRYHLMWREMPDTESLTLLR
ncbi:MAG: hypothetical protein OSA08_02125 [Arenicellales bacterium]|nr:hypothetical protein [Arenicellales bacterium]